MKRRHHSGFAVPPIVYIIAAIALIGALAGLYVKIHHDAYAAGAASVQEKWDAATIKAQKKAAEDVAARDAIIADLKKQLADEQVAAGDYQTKWQGAIDELHRKGTQLVACVRRGRSAVEEARAANDRANLTKKEVEDIQASGTTDFVALLSYRYLGLWDSAWTGTRGEPLFGDPQQLAERYGASAGADSISPYSTDDLLKNHGVNAARQSECLRRLDQVKVRLETLSKDWEQRHKAMR